MRGSIGTSGSSCVNRLNERQLTEKCRYSNAKENVRAKERAFNIFNAHSCAEEKSRRAILRQYYKHLDTRRFHELIGFDCEDDVSRPHIRDDKDRARSFSVRASLSPPWAARNSPRKFIFATG